MISKVKKSEFKGQVVSKFDLGLLNAYKLCIFIEISVKISMAKKKGGQYLSCVTNGEFYFCQKNI